MSPTLAINTVTGTFPPQILLGMGVVVLISAALGFVAGCYYTRNSAKMAMTKAKTQVSKLFGLVLETLETAQETCGLLKDFPNLLLTKDQTRQLDRRHNSLVETVERIVEKQLDLEAEKDDAKESKKKGPKFEVNWVRTPEDHTTGLPSRESFDANFASLLGQVKQTEINSGLLLVKVDKLDQLASRYGSSGSTEFLRKMSSIICRTVRDNDLVCKFGGDTFVVLMPAVDAEIGRRLSWKIRTTVRSHRFQLGENGPEVLVTASFGFTPCLPSDDFELILNRAGNALSRSQRRGRNQLHVHDGNSLEHCTASR